mmetsp:Transcript_19192/g.59076  ORF Transcript_19192/g.59076 Transcript_19192/m.59076 type:complete len:89 (+) Transcript_19192:154-420(+)
MSGANAHPLVDAAQQFFQKKKKEAAALERACTKPSMREFREMLTSIAFLCFVVGFLACVVEVFMIPIVAVITGKKWENPAEHRHASRW